MKSDAARGVIARTPIAVHNASSKVLTLRDGRRLGYSEFGAPGGRPMLYCHGFPASRLDGQIAHEAALRLDVRLIAPDRPGFGLSDFQAKRRIVDWPRDLLELADALMIARFPLLGISGGAPYAVACAGAIPDRLTTAGIVSGLGQADRAEYTAGMNSFARASFALARSAPLLSRLFNRALAPLLRRSPRLLLKLLASHLPPSDQEVLAVPVRKVTIPVAAGRNLAVLVEAAVRNFVLNQRGIDSTKEFIERQQKLMDEGGAA